MELHGVTHDVGHLVVSSVVHALHAVEDASLHGFQAVLDMGYGAFENHVRRIVQEPVLVHAAQMVDGSGVETVHGLIVGVAVNGEFLVVGHLLVVVCCIVAHSIVQGLFKICSEILLEDIYKSNQKLKDIKELTLIGKGRGDSYYYKINDNYDVTDILGEYEYNNIKYHIDYCTVKDIIILNERYKCRFELDKKYKFQSLYLYDTNGHRTENPFLIHLAFKLFNGGELNEKDLAVGYDDQIFFHWDKSEI